MTVFLVLFISPDCTRCFDLQVYPLGEIFKSNHSPNVSLTEQNVIRMQVGFELYPKIIVCTVTLKEVKGLHDDQIFHSPPPPPKKILKV